MRTAGMDERTIAPVPAHLADHAVNSGAPPAPAALTRRGERPDIVAALIDQLSDLVVQPAARVSAVGNPHLTGFPQRDARRTQRGQSKSAQARAFLWRSSV